MSNKPEDFINHFIECYADEYNMVAHSFSNKEGTPLRGYTFHVEDCDGIFSFTIYNERTIKLNYTSSGKDINPLTDRVMRVTITTDTYDTSRQVFRFFFKDSFESAIYKLIPGHTKLGEVIKKFEHLFEDLWVYGDYSH